MNCVHHDKIKIVSLENAKNKIGFFLGAPISHPALTFPRQEL